MTLREWRRIRVVRKRKCWGALRSTKGEEQEVVESCVIKTVIIFEFYILTAKTMNITVLSGMTPCSLVDGCQTTRCHI